jgi:transposase, IS5 family
MMQQFALLVLPRLCYTPLRNALESLNTVIKERIKMRQKCTRQMSIFSVMARHDIGKELEAFSEVLDATPKMLDLVYADLTSRSRKDVGREGMTAEQVLRCVALKQYRNLSYDELAFHLEDSKSFRAFARMEHGQYPSDSTLQENIKPLSEETWEAVHQCLMQYAREAGIDTARQIRIDSTVVETDIHDPTDSSLLFDGIRVITHLLDEGHELSPRPDYSYSDHCRVAKKRLIAILNAKKKEDRVSHYRDLTHYAGKVVGYAKEAILALESYKAVGMDDMLIVMRLLASLKRAVGLLEKVISQTERRVFRGEQVPVSDKVVSFFEDHSDIIVKGRREVQYGHKIFLSGGKSNLILDCVILRGNPADSDQYLPMLERHKTMFGKAPLKVSADGGFASKDNLSGAKKLKVRDAAFAKKRGLSIIDMAKSAWVYKKLRNFRAGIEANISTLKRAFGLDRCNWKGWEGFKRYVWSSIFAYNLQVIARIKLEKAKLAAA